MRQTMLVAAAVLVAGFAGCLGNGEDVDAADAATPEEEPRASEAQQSLAGPRAAFTAENADGERAQVYPYAMEGQSARPPVNVTFTGEFRPEDCASFFSINDLVNPWQEHAFTDLLEPGDAVMGTVTLTFENADDAYADIHLMVSVPGQLKRHVESVADERGTVTQSFDVQFAFPGDDGDGAWAIVTCWWGVQTRPIPYTVDVELVFAEGVVPAETPHLVPVDEGVTELLVSGVPATPEGGVTGHYRVFTPDDRLLGEYALNSNQAFSTVPVPEPGDYVIIVDHSENGMLALGANAPPTDPNLVLLDTDWAMYVDVAQETMDRAAEAAEFDLPRVPLNLAMWVGAAEGNAGGGQDLVMHVDGPRGNVMHVEIPRYATYRPPGASWSWFFGLSPDGWVYDVDHHAFSEGAHTLTVDAGAFQGEILRYYVTYLRPGDTGVPAPAGGVGGGSGARAAAAAADLPIPW